MSNSSNKVIIVDDDIDMQQLLRMSLAKKFDVVTCSSGKGVLSILDSFKPDLILMDVDMPGLNGYETCRQIRQNGLTIPIIFITSYQDAEVHLSAYEAGGDDVITKPVDSEVLLRKVTLAIQKKAETSRFEREALSMHNLAMSFLSNAGENGIMLNFVRNGAQSISYEMLARYLVDALGDLGVPCIVVLRHEGGQTALTSYGEPNELEQAILKNMSRMGRLVEFQRQFIVNFDQASVMIWNAPTDAPETVGRIRDNVAILAETAAALCDIVATRIQSRAQAEQMQVAVITAANAVEKVRHNHHRLLLDTRILLQGLIDKVEASYSWLGTTNAQEAAISGNMNESVQGILQLLSSESNFDEEISKVHDALNPQNNNNESFLF